MKFVWVITFLFVPHVAFAMPEFTALYSNITEAVGKGESGCSDSLMKHGSQNQIKVTAVLRVPDGDKDNYDLTRVSLIVPGRERAICTASTASCLPRTENGPPCNCMRSEAKGDSTEYHMNYEVAATKALSGTAVRAVLGVKDFDGTIQPLLSDINVTMPVIYMSVHTECVFSVPLKTDTKSVKESRSRGKRNYIATENARFKRRSGKSDSSTQESGSNNELMRDVLCCARNLMPPYQVKFVIADKTMLAESVECVTFKDEFKPGETKTYKISYKELGPAATSCARSKSDDKVTLTSEHSGAPPGLPRPHAAPAPAVVVCACAAVMAASFLVAGP